MHAVSLCVSFAILPTFRQPRVRARVRVFRVSVQLQCIEIAGGCRLQCCLRPEWKDTVNFKLMRTIFLQVLSAMDSWRVCRVWGSGG